MSKLITTGILVSIAMCINNALQGMEQFPKDIVKKIGSYVFIESVNCPLQEMDGSIYEYDAKKAEEIMNQSLHKRQNYSETPSDIASGFEKIIHTYVYQLRKVYNMNYVLSLLNVRFSNMLKQELKEYKKQYEFIFFILKQDLVYHMDQALSIAAIGKRAVHLWGDQAFAAWQHNNLCLSCYSCGAKNKGLVYFIARDPDLSNMILEKYLSHALELPDDAAHRIKTGNTIPLDTQCYYYVLQFLLRIALERTSNNLCIITTDNPLNTQPAVVHEFLEISLHQAANHSKKNAYIITKKISNGWFIKENTNQTCIIA